MGSECIFPCVILLLLSSLVMILAMIFFQSDAPKGCPFVKRLGRGSWRLFHAILNNVSETPPPSEKERLEKFIMLFAHLYPCKNCSLEFLKILEKNPPKLRTRAEAILWGCRVHNEVNERLQKPMYDCQQLL